MLFRHPSHPWVVRLFVGNAVPSATFNDLANTSAKLGNYFWLGFIIMGLSPDKKRHALHGAQRRGNLRMTDMPLRFAPQLLLTKKLNFTSGQPSDSPTCCA